MLDIGNTGLPYISTNILLLNIFDLDLLPVFGFIVCQVRLGKNIF